MSVLAIGVIGTTGWALAYESGAWKPSPTSSEKESADMPIGALVLGYFSAVAYLGARIPQIIKNARDKSCEGMFYLFSSQISMPRDTNLLRFGRSIPPLLHPFPVGKFDVRCWYPFPLDGASICDEEPAMVDRKPGHHG